MKTYTVEVDVTEHHTLYVKAKDIKEAAHLAKRSMSEEEDDLLANRVCEDGSVHGEITRVEVVK